MVTIVSGHHHRHPLVSLPPPQEGAIVKHVLSLRVQGPEVPLAWVARLSGYLDEAVIETQIMADAVLPGGEPVLVVGESVLDELTDAIEGESALRGLDYGHGDERDVGVGRLAVLPIPSVGDADCPALLKVIFHLDLDAHVLRVNTGLIPSPSCSHIFI